MASLDDAAGASKRPKLDESVRVQLKSVEGAELGPALEVPLASGPAELGSIVSKLKQGTQLGFLRHASYQLLNMACLKLCADLEA